jgi:hypothetical protein
MNQHPVCPQGTCTTSFQFAPRRGGKPARIVLAVGSAPQRFMIQDLFERQGWEVQLVSCPKEARRFAHKKRTVATFLADEPPQYETGWLTCGKLLLAQPGHRVVIVGTKPMVRAEQFATFVGAMAYIPPSACETVIAHSVRLLSAAVAENDVWN